MNEATNKSAKFKRHKKFIVVDRNAVYPLAEALEMVKSCATAKFDESIDVAINLGIDAKKSDQNVRGSVVMPAGLGKKVRVAVMAQGDSAKAALAAGADKVGFDDLAEEIKSGKIEFDVLIATPDSMRLVGQLGTILGPKGLMPNPKVGTVTKDPAEAVKNAKAGQVQFRNDKAGVVHCPVGRASFSAEALTSNIKTLVDALSRAKPASSKGIFLKKASVSSTMGIGVPLELSTLN